MTVCQVWSSPTCWQCKRPIFLWCRAILASVSLNLSRGERLLHVFEYTCFDYFSWSHDFSLLNQRPNWYLRLQNQWNPSDIWDADQRCIPGEGSIDRQVTIVGSAAIISLTQDVNIKLSLETSVMETRYNDADSPITHNSSTQLLNIQWFCFKQTIYIFSFYTTLS